jgi:hypothetical protein
MKKCFECEATEDLHEHHVVPRSNGGTKTITLCHQCHMKAHGRDGKGLNHSRLTKEGLKKAKQQGVKLGASNPKVRDAIGAQTQRTVEKYKTIFEECLKNPALSYRGKCSMNKIAKWLTEERIQTPRGKTIWSTQQVKQILKSINKEERQ